MRAASFALRVLANRVGAVPRPSYCTYLTTYRCNARCGMCDSWRVKPGSELAPDEVRRVFARLHRLDAVRLSGGEPFLRTDLLDVAEAIVAGADPMVLHITTNGSFPDRALDLAARFSRKARLRFMVSFDGLAEEHDANRGADVTFALALETATRLHAAGAVVSINHTVISARSLASGAALRAQMTALGIDVHSVLAYSDSSMYSIKLRGKKAEHLIVPTGYPLHPDLVGADTVAFVKRELAAVDELADLPTRIGKRYYLRGLLARLEEQPSPSPKPSCVALRSHVRILPDGRVPVCQFNTETVGNLRDQSFEEIWHGAAARDERRWVDACPGCWAECEVMPNAVYTGDIVRAVV